MENEIPLMADIIPEGRNGKFYIRHKKYEGSEAKLHELRNMLNGHYWGEEQKVITVLNHDDNRFGMIMSDSAMDRRTNNQIIRESKGDVLIVGLGIGMILVPILAKDTVNRVVVIEKYKEVINLVSPHLKKLSGFEKLEIVHADGFKADIPKTEKFDVIYFDIWNGVCTDNLEEISKLKKIYRKNRKGGAVVFAWQEDELRCRKRAENRERGAF